MTSGPGAEHGFRADLIPMVTWWLFLATLVFRLVIADRGFDITDEGYALVAARHPEDLRVSTSSSGWATHLLFEAGGETIAGFRRAGILALVSASWILAAGVFRFSSHTRLFDLLPRAGLGALVFYSAGVTSPSYNLILSASMLASMGLTLAATAAQPAPSRVHLFAALAAGTALGLGCLAKPPGGVVIGVLEAAIFLSAGSARQGLLPAWLAGGALALLAQFAVQGSTEFFRMILLGLEVFSRSKDGHSPEEFLPRVARETWTLLKNAVVPLSGALVASVPLRRLESRFSRPVPLASVASAATLLGLLAVRGNLTGGHRAATDGVTATAILTAMGLGLSTGFLEGRWPPRRQATSIVLLALSPILMTLGTNTPLSFSLLFFITPWFLLPVAVAPAKSQAAGLTLSLIAAAVTIGGPFVSPYRWVGNLSDQTVPITLGAPTSLIKVDRETARFIRALRTSARRCGLATDTPVLGMTWVPGLVFAVGGRAPTTAYFYGSYHRAARNVNAFALGLVDPEDHAVAYLMYTSDGPVRPESLTIGSRRFPRDYDVCFASDMPYGRKETVRLFRPRRLAPPPVGT